MNRLILYLLLAAAAVTLYACIPGGGTYHENHTAGFFSGIWHGWIAPVSLIISIFSGQTRIYEIHNTGFFYDLGFYMAVISGFGGLSFTRKKFKSDKKKKDPAY